MAMREKIVDGLAVTAGETMGLLTGVRRRVKDEIRTRMEDAATRMDLVPRADVEKLEALLVESRQEQDALKQRIQKLEDAVFKKTGS